MKTHPQKKRKRQEKCKDPHRLFSILGFSVWLDLWVAAVVLANKSASKDKR